MILWDKIKDILNWAVSNFWNLFSFVGVIATIYVGFFYVPDYVEDIAISKQNIVHQELVSDLQELIFYGEPLSLEDIDSVISGKELAFSMKYKFTSTELLNQIQNSFLKNKFIPLEKRNELINTIKVLRSQYKAPKQPSRQSKDFSSVLSNSIAFLTAILSLLATISIFVKNRDDKEVAVDIASSAISSNFQYGSSGDRTLAAYEYENMVGEVLAELSILKCDSELSKKNDFDFIANINGQEMIVEVKAYSKLLGIGTAREFAYRVNEIGRGGILIAKSGVTKRTEQLIEAHNKLSDSQQIIVISGESKNEIKQAISKLIK